MADVAFSDLTALTSLAEGDLVCATDISESGSEKSKKVELGTLRDWLMLKGSLIRPKFTWDSVSSLKIGAGFYDVDGKHASWASELTESLSGLAANTKYYVYLDYSAITSGTAITATEIIVSTTAPTYSHAKVGQYNGSDRCIFGFITEAATAEMREFFHGGGEYVQYANQIADRAIADLDTTWTDVTLTIPGFATEANIVTKQSAESESNSCVLSYRVNGQTGTTGHELSHTRNNEWETPYNPAFRVMTDSSQIIEIKHSESADQQAGINTNGWFLPVGM